MSLSVSSNRLDVFVNQLTDKAALKEYGDHGQFSACVIGDGQLLLSGGYHYGNRVSHMFKFNADLIKVRKMPVRGLQPPKVNLQKSKRQGRHVLLFGGFVQNTHPINELLVFDHVAERFVTVEYVDGAEAVDVQSVPLAEGEEEEIEEESLGMSVWQTFFGKTKTKKEVQAREEETSGGVGNTAEEAEGEDVKDRVVRVHGEVPISRGFTTCVQTAGRLIFFAGRTGAVSSSSGWTHDNEVWMLQPYACEVDIDGELDENETVWEWEWVKVETVNEGPLPRGTHCAGLLNGQGMWKLLHVNQGHPTMVVFGGRTEKEIFDDLWLLDLVTLTWKQIEAGEEMEVYDPLKKEKEETQLTPRQVGGAQEQGVIKVLGGEKDAGEESGEKGKSSKGKESTESKKHAGFWPCARAYLSAQVVYDYVLLVIGGGDTTSPTRFGQDVIGFNFLTMKWNHAHIHMNTEPMGIDKGDVYLEPPKVNSDTVWALRNRVYVYGSPSGSFDFVLWQMNVKPPEWNMDVHQYYPLRFKQVVKTLLLIWYREEYMDDDVFPLNEVPFEVLERIIAMLSLDLGMWGDQDAW